MRFFFSSGLMKSYTVFVCAARAGYNNTNNPAHSGVTEWNYFVTDLVYEEDDGSRIDCYMNIDVKHSSTSDWFYSFAIKKGTAPQTIHAGVTDETSATIPNNSISEPSENVKDMSNNCTTPTIKSLYKLLLVTLG